MSARKTLPGEVWRVDFGLAAKVRPAVILSDYPTDDELALLIAFLIRRSCAVTAGNSPFQSLSSNPAYFTFNKSNRFPWFDLAFDWEHSRRASSAI
jgi:hypothetical protein